MTIYSSMPLQGAGGPQSRSIVNGMKLALAQNDGRAGDFKIKFVSLDNSTAQAGSWTPEATDPYSIYGYESMQLALDAIRRSKTGKKADIVKALFATQDRHSALGTYSIDQYGDTTLTEMALEGVQNGQLKFIKVIKGAAL